MSRLTITIDMDNAAFEDDAVTEVECILSGVLNKWLARGEVTNATLMDTNGNRVGSATVKP